MHTMVKPHYVSCSQSLPVRSVQRKCPNDAAITARVVDDSLEISVYGELDLRLHTRLWTASRWHTQRFAQYVFVLDHVTTLRDSGLAWLMMFDRQVARRQSTLRLQNSHSEWQTRLQSAGLTLT